jgi:hypothetical protein
MLQRQIMKRMVKGHSHENRVYAAQCLQLVLWRAAFAGSGAWIAACCWHHPTAPLIGQKK